MLSHYMSLWESRPSLYCVGVCLGKPDRHNVCRNRGDEASVFGPFQRTLYYESKTNLAEYKTIQNHSPAIFATKIDSEPYTVE